MFYLGGALLGLLAAAFACWPLLRLSRRDPGRSSKKQVANEVQHERAVRDVYRARLVELRGETEDTPLRAEIENELGAVLLVDEQRAAPVDDDVSSGSTRRSAGIVVLAVMIPLCGAVLYSAVADPMLAQIRGAEEVLTLTVEDKVALESWALRLSARTEAAPADNKSWYLLGHAYLKLGDYSRAAEAFATTSNITGDDLNVQIYWLQARYMAAAGVLDEVSKNLAAKILEQQPNIPVVLEILALDAFHRGAAEESISLLNRAMTGASDIRQQASFATAIRQVREGMTTSPPGVTVDISTTSEVPPHATVFVIARPPGGGMPYAVVKRPAFLVPFDVRLDDLVSMSPARKLSDAEEFEVIVRLSATGAAMAQQGDWQWQSQLLNTTAPPPAPLNAVLAPP